MRTYEHHRQAGSGESDTSDLIIRPWHRRGVHRLYVSRPDGTGVGYWDLVTDEPYPDAATDLEVLTRRIRRWSAEHPELAGRWAAVPARSARVLAHQSGACGCFALIVTSWNRFGHHRLYVNKPDGAEIGYWDVDSKSVYPGDSATYDTVLHAIALRNAITAGMPRGSVAETREAPAVSGTREERPDSRLRAVLDRVRRAGREERSRRMGYDGEEKVGAILGRVARRDPTWREPIRAVPVGDRGSDVDHVFVGSGGVFTVNAKFHPRSEIWAGSQRVIVNGQDRQYIPKSTQEAERAAALLSHACGFEVHVEAVIVIVGARTVRIGAPADGVHVVESGYLTKWLLARQYVHADGVVQSIFDAARSPAVWRPPKAA